MHLNKLACMFAIGLDTLPYIRNACSVHIFVYRRTTFFSSIWLFFYSIISINSLFLLHVEVVTFYSLQISDHLSEISTCASAPCLNGATCFESNSIFGGYFCLCATGFIGTHCENGIVVFDTATTTHIQPFIPADEPLV